jgi:hypothetical protein
MSKWLDTETKAMLQQAPPEKDAPPDTGMFTLVLLKKGNNLARLVRALGRIPGLSQGKAEYLAKGRCPVPVAGGLSLGDAMLGQFELVCCDSISVFLRDGVAASADDWYLTPLYRQFRQSREFQSVPVTINAVPETSLGERFVDQFLGEADEGGSMAGGFPLQQFVMRKKARIMSHWAEKLGIEVSCADDE